LDIFHCRAVNLVRGGIFSVRHYFVFPAKAAFDAAKAGIYKEKK